MLSVYWHINPKVAEKVKFICKDLEGNLITPLIEDKWCSNYYGELEDSIRYTYTAKKGLTTKITIS